MTPRSFIALALVFVMVLGVACSARADEQTRIQLKWVHQAQFAGFYLAEANGYYEEEGLDVTLLEGGPGIDKIDRLLAGEADFCVDSIENLLLRREAGDDIVAVTVSFQRNPLVFVAKADSGIVTPEDCMEKTAAILEADYADVQFYAMLDRLGLDSNGVAYADYDFAHEAFYADGVDLTLAYVSGGLIRMRNDGYDVVTLWPGDYGVNLYADALITTREMIQSRPDVVEGVVRATIQGWEDAVLAPETAVETILSYAHDSDRETQTAMIYATIPLLTLGTHPIGWMDTGVWTQMINLLTQYNVVTALLNPQASFDTSFLEAIYAEEE